MRGEGDLGDWARLDFATWVPFPRAAFAALAGDDIVEQMTNAVLMPL